MINARLQAAWIATFVAVLVWSGTAPHDYPTWLLEVAPALIAAAVLVSIGILFYRWYQRRQAPISRVEHVEPPHIRARRELRGLEAQQYFEKGLIKQHYFVFSEILRHYLESIRHFPAAEMTTEEIARHVRDTSQDQEFLPLLRQADLVKFADTIPTPDHKVHDVEAARTYIRQTCPMQTEAADAQYHPEARP